MTIGVRWRTGTSYFAQRSLSSPQMLEIHPFGNFIPKNAKYLILGSFPGKPDATNDWFYGAKRNQFWKIIERVYKTKLDSKDKKKKLLKRIYVAISDIILSCERKRGSNMDNNLINITYNDKALKIILTNNKIDILFFTSRFVEKKFKKLFPNYMELFPKTKLYTLPSPSPRYAKLTLEEKIRSYKKRLLKRG